MASRRGPSTIRSAGRCSRSSRSTGPPGGRQRASWSSGSRISSPRVEELGLEGLVAKRLSSTYFPGRRCTAWVKHKLRREERFAVTGIRRTREGIAQAVFVARPLEDGSLISAGSIELGLGPELVDQLERRFAELPPRRRGSVSWYPAEVSVIASVHGLQDGPVRDAILREIVESEL